MMWADLNKTSFSCLNWAGAQTLLFSVNVLLLMNNCKKPDAWRITKDPTTIKTHQGLRYQQAIKEETPLIYNSFCGTEMFPERAHVDPWKRFLLRLENPNSRTPRWFWGNIIRSSIWDCLLRKHGDRSGGLGPSPTETNCCQVSVSSRIKCVFALCSQIVLRTKQLESTHPPGSQRHSCLNPSREETVNLLLICWDPDIQMI